jgi:hypothetical protein
MSAGSLFQAAWSAASDLGRSAASKLASGARWVGHEAHEALDWAGDKAARGLRGVAHFAADHGADGVGRISRAKAPSRETVASSYEQVQKSFAPAPPSTIVSPCQTNANPAADKAADGWLMAPSGDGCALVPPQEGAASARAASRLSNSKCCQMRRAAGEQPREIVYVNGINTTRETHCATLRAIADQTCARVIGVYNATEGFSADATAEDRRLIKAAASGAKLRTHDGRNPAVDTLSDVLLQDRRANTPTELWAHSQGGAVASLAVYEAENEYSMEERRAAPTLLKVKSFGSAAPKWMDGPEYQHFVHVNDATPTLLGLGASSFGDRSSAGAGASVVRFSGDPNSAEPFETESPEADMIPKLSADHDIVQTYLKMERQRNGGCPPPAGACETP